MTTSMRWVHRFCVVFQAGSAVVWAWVYVQHPYWLALFNFTWCIAFGAYSYNALRAGRRRERYESLIACPRRSTTPVRSRAAMRSVVGDESYECQCIPSKPFALQ